MVLIQIKKGTKGTIFTSEYELVLPNFSYGGYNTKQQSAGSVCFLPLFRHAVIGHLVSVLINMTYRLKIKWASCWTHEFV